MSDLLEHVKSIAADLSHPERMDADTWQDDCGPNAADYCQDVLDVEYIIGSDGSFKGARLLVAFGGPNIWIDTRHGRVEGYWWDVEETAHFYDALGLHDFWEEMWACCA